MAQNSKMIIEFIVFLYNLAFATTSVVEQSFFIYQTCYVDLNFNKTICYELEKYPIEKKTVHVLVNQFQNLNVLLSETITFVSSVCITLLFKHFNKKNFIVLGLIGKLIYVLMVIINSLFAFKTNMILYTAVVPCCITGSDIILISNVFAYVIKNTTEDKKIFRITLLNAIILSTMPIGTLIGKLLFSDNGLFKHSYAKMFSVNALLIVLSLILVLFLKPESEKTVEEYIDITTIALYENEIIKQNFKEKLIDLLGNYKLILCIIISALHVLQRTEKFYIFLFTQYKLSWSFDKFSNFRFGQTSLLMLVSLVTSIVLSKIKISNLILIVIGAFGNIIARLFYIVAEEDIIFYIGGALTALGPLISSSIKCYMTKFVDSKYLHVLFVITASIENLLSGITSFIYSFLYISENKESIFGITIVTQLMIILIVCVIKKI